METILHGGVWLLGLMLLFFLAYIVTSEEIFSWKTRIVAGLLLAVIFMLYRS